MANGNLPAPSFVRQGVLGLLALAAVVREPLHLEVDIEPTVARPGQTVTVRLVVRNTSAHRVAVVRALFDGGLTASTDITVTCGDNVVPVGGGEGSPEIGQVVAFSEVTSDRFVDLAPGQAEVLAWATFNGRRAVGETPPSTKAGYAQWKPRVTPLAPGVYTVHGGYEFEKTARRRSYEFTPSAKARWQRAFVGKLEGQGQFRVRP